MDMPARDTLGRVGCQEDLDIDFVRWTLFGPEEKLLAQGKAMIHTSCRSESSNKRLVNCQAKVQVQSQVQSPKSSPKSKV